METTQSIKVLPQELVDKISAGEVINRPASVLKELIENSIDAKATKIEINIEEGGKKLIEVIDNGIGIKPDEIVLAVKRHTTSKIDSMDDLYNLNSYGFRGEALYTISSVSKFSLISKPEEYPLGKEIYIEGGKILSLSDTGCPSGTKVKVKDLFFNIPARRKFLKSSRVEFTHILDIFIKYAVSYPNIHFKLFKDGKIYLNLEPTNLINRLEDIYPKLKGKLLDVEAENEIGNLKGFIALDESYKKQGFIFINRRPIKNRELKKIISSYIGDKFFLIFLDIYPYFVDFNIHPSKEEVKFRKDKPIYDLIKSALKQENKKKYILKTSDKLSLSQSVATYTKQKTTDNFKLLGQVEDTFLLVYLDGDIYIVDQHIAHERINYEILYKKYLKNEEIKSKNLNRKIKINLSPLEREYFSNHLEELKKLGFGIVLHENYLEIEKIPEYLTRKEAKDILQEIINSEDIYLPIDKLIGEIACAKSLKAGEFIDNEEAIALLKNWLETNNPNLCPHGRPIYYKISLSEVKKVLGRN
jgi:DNA mismatch repair protein MutL